MIGTRGVTGDIAKVQTVMEVIWDRVRQSKMDSRWKTFVAAGVGGQVQVYRSRIDWI